MTLLTFLSHPFFALHATFRLLKIDYANTRPWRGTEDVTYIYAPILMEGSWYKHYDAVYASYRESRTLLNKHGIFLEVPSALLKDYSICEHTFKKKIVVITISSIM